MNQARKTDPKKLAEKWNKRWEETKIYQPDVRSAKKPYYNLMMFPYPSAEGLHIGNMYAYTGADVYGRFMRMKGYDVFEPIGLDGFGIHSENYALKIGKHPMDQAKISEKRFYEQLRMIGNSFDWPKTLETYDPVYYKWTQWIFVKLFKAGLVEKKKAPVNWCPSCKTVLADEQVIGGHCERCGSQVEIRELEQWFLKITDYSERLLKDLEKIDWSEKVKTAQRNWIGKSEGARIKFQLVEGGEIEVFTTRPDTLFGATFLVLSSKHPLLKKHESKLPKDVKDYINASDKRKIEAEDADKPKTGFDTGLSAINPVNNEKIPVWVADYVLLEYGTGAIMAVPAHDERDFEFAKKFGLPIRQVISKAGSEELEKAYVGEGKLINSGEWDGWEVPKDIPKVIEYLEKKRIGKREVKFHLRDWLISRQRYWGVPIPMIFCEKCGWQPVPEEDLPVELPYVENFKPLGTGESPLAKDPGFVNVKCPNCHGNAKRETEVSDTFLDSSWYFLRYPSIGFDAVPFDSEITKKWLPVDMYIGGAEHSVLHLLYSRFITKALKDLGYLNFDEPFTKFRAHGIIIKEGAKMSKSRGNIVNPDEYINKYGADTVRLYLMFLGPFEQGGDFRDSGIEGIDRFLKRVQRLVENQTEGASARNLSDKNLDRSMAKTIKEVTADIENLRYNTAIAHLMEYINDLTGSKDAIDKKHVKTLVILLAPFAPYLSEELWEMMGEKGSVHKSEWPSFNEQDLAKDNVTIAVQINGKLRDTLVIESDRVLSSEEAGKLAKQSEKVKSHLDSKEVKKVIYVPGKIINLVT